MKIVYAALKYDYGRKDWGFSPQHTNFYDALINLDPKRNQIIYFPFDEIMTEVGRKEMNRRLVKLIKKEKPDFTFFCLFTDEISKSALKEIQAGKWTKTFNWFTDDHWRFDNFSKYYCWYFDYIGTTDSQAVEKYRRIGYQNVMRTQWACNEHIFKPPQPGLIGKRAESDFKYGVTFMGMAHGKRKELFDQMKRGGLAVDCYGSGWPNGRVKQDQMIEIFATSKINLNLTMSSDVFNLKGLAKFFINRRADNSYQISSPLLWPANVKSLLNKRRRQIKGRNFEVPGCGGFVISMNADDLGSYYVDGKEIVLVETVNDFIEKGHYYLNHPAEREKIAKAGYDRTIKEHTFEKRLEGICRKTGVA